MLSNNYDERMCFLAGIITNSKCKSTCKYCEEIHVKLVLFSAAGYTHLRYTWWVDYNWIINSCVGITCFTKLVSYISHHHTVYRASHYGKDGTGTLVY